MEDTFFCFFVLKKNSMFFDVVFILWVSPVSSVVFGEWCFVLGCGGRVVVFLLLWRVLVVFFVTGGVARSSGTLCGPFSGVW